jgi:hypothetical protein
MTAKGNGGIKLVGVGHHRILDFFVFLCTVDTLTARTMSPLI